MKAEAAAGEAAFTTADDPAPTMPSGISAIVPPVGLEKEVGVKVIQSADLFGSGEGWSPLAEQSVTNRKSAQQKNAKMLTRKPRCRTAC